MIGFDRPDDVAPLQLLHCAAYLCSPLRTPSCSRRRYTSNVRMSRQSQRQLGQQQRTDSSTYDEIEHRPHSTATAAGGDDSEPNPQAEHLADERDTNERTALLGSTTSRDYRTEAARDRQALAEAGHPEERKRPWSLRFDLAFAVLLLLANGYFLVTSLVSFNTPFVANTGLPPHRGSLGLPVWSSFLGCTLNT